MAVCFLLTAGLAMGTPGKVDVTLHKYPQAVVEKYRLHNYPVGGVNGIANMGNDWGNWCFQNPVSADNPVVTSPGLVNVTLKKFSQEEVGKFQLHNGPEGTVNWIPNMGNGWSNWCLKNPPGSLRSG